MSIKGLAQHLGCSEGSVITAPLHPHSNVCSGLPVRLPSLGGPWWTLALCPLPPSGSPSLYLPSPRPLLRPVFRAPDPLSRVGLSGASTQPGHAEAQRRGAGRCCCDLHRCRLYQADWRPSEVPVPAFLTPGSPVSDPEAGHCQGWVPWPEEFWMELPPWCPAVGTLVLGAGLAPSFSFVYAGWQGGLLAGSGSSLLLNSFSMESLWAGVEGMGASPEAGLSRPWTCLPCSSCPQTAVGRLFVSLGSAHQVLAHRLLCSPSLSAAQASLSHGGPSCPTIGELSKSMAFTTAWGQD